MTTTFDPTRRQFLTRLGSAGAALTYFPSFAFQDTLPRRPIPTSGEELPIVGLGSTKPVLEIPTEGMEPIRSVLRALLAGGGRVVDTAPRTEAVDAEFGQILAEPWLGNEMFLATKINATGKDEGVQQMRQTQRLFHRQRLDLVQIESLTDLTTQWTNLRNWKETGEARYIGVTVSSDELHERLAEFMQRESPDFVHVNYSVMETAAEDTILPLAQDLQVAVLTNRPFMNGSYFGRVRGRALPDWVQEFDCSSWAQFSLKYILAHTAVTCALTETTNPQHMRENLQAGMGRLPSADQKRRMRALIRDM